jgi:hypothetical protein
MFVSFSLHSSATNECARGFRQGNRARRFKSSRVVACKWFNRRQCSFAPRVQSAAARARRACDARRVDIVEMLLRAGANVDGVDDNDRTASFAAVEARSVDVLAALLAHRPNLEIKEKSSNSPLELSIALQVHTVDSLDVDQRRCLTRRFAQWNVVPARFKEHHAIQALLNRGVVVNQLRDSSNFTPLHLIAFQFLAQSRCRRLTCWPL